MDRETLLTHGSTRTHKPESVVERTGVASEEEPEGYHSLRTPILTVRDRTASRRALNAELDPRVKNVLATVSAIIGQTQKAGRSPVDFVAGINRRIKSLAGTHELLSRCNWHGVPLTEIIRRELTPYSARGTKIRGPSVTLKADATQAVAMVLHEVTTNAAKSGAFSNQTGRVSVQWEWPNNGSQDRLIIEWLELGGPQF